MFVQQRHASDEMHPVEVGDFFRTLLDWIGEVVQGCEDGWRAGCKLNAEVGYALVPKSVSRKKHGTAHGFENVSRGDGCHQGLQIGKGSPMVRFSREETIFGGKDGVEACVMRLDGRLDLLLKFVMA